MLMVEHPTLNLDSGVTHGSPTIHVYPEGGGVVFSNDPGQLRVGSVSVEEKVRTSVQRSMEIFSSFGLDKGVSLTLKGFDARNLYLIICTKSS